MNAVWFRLPYTLIFLMSLTAPGAKILAEPKNGSAALATAVRPDGPARFDILSQHAFRDE